MPHFFRDGFYVVYLLPFRANFCVYFAAFFSFTFLHFDVRCAIIKSMSTYYTVLGLPETATDEQIKQAYRALAKKYHPDLHPGDASMAKKFAEVNEAMEVLGTPQKRKEYDTKRANEKKQAQDAAAARQAAARQAVVNAQRARASMGARPTYAGTAQGAAQVVNDAYRKGYNEGFAAANAQRNSSAETWKKSADNWQKEAEKCREEVSVLKAALEKTRQRASDAEASARRMEASLQLQRNATEEARRNTEAEIAAKEELRAALEAKINAEREARRYSDADKVRLSREVMRLKEENNALRVRLGEGAATTPKAEEASKQETTGTQSDANAFADSAFAAYDAGTTGAQTDGDTQSSFAAQAKSEPQDVAQESVTQESGQTAPQFEEENVAQTNGDTIALLRAQAESGDGEAAVRLGKLYLDGDGTQKDASEAVRLFTMGMAAGNADALYHLGLCCINGEGADFDLNRGLQLLHEAADQGSKLAAQFLRDAGK